ncbi:MAG: D-tyrosyl-tRNA(Tyr) deacylase [candidate division Zixibacteria bacterium]|nr:D-tyrosyl-tRNA(Tyr) deacylase [candidate division Zixibacteria bacterium]
MRLVLQRVSWARVKVDDQIVGEIGEGLLALVGATTGDSEQDAEILAEKAVNLRIFEDDQGKMNLSLKDVGGSLLAVSQFTLYADTRKGRRPAFVNALEPVAAEHLFEHFQTQVREMGVTVAGGVFGAKMAVELCNWGPVTIILNSEDKRK